MGLVYGYIFNNFLCNIKFKIYISVFFVITIYIIKKETERGSTKISRMALDVASMEEDEEEELDTLSKIVDTARGDDVTEETSSE